MARMLSQRSRYNGRRRLNGKKRYSSKYPSNKSINRKVKKIQDMIELKYIDTYFNDTVADDGNDLLLMNAVGVGTSNTSRTGSEISLTSLQFRGSVTMDSLQLDPILLRMIVFFDRQANSAAPITNVFTPGTGSLLNGTVITDPIYMPYSYEQQDRYRVLYDKVIQLNPKVIKQADYTGGDTTELIPVTQHFKKRIKLGRKVKYDLANIAPTIADIATNSLYVVFYSDNTTNLPTMRFGARVYFKDA